MFLRLIRPAQRALGWAAILTALGGAPLLAQQQQQQKPQQQPAGGAPTVAPIGPSLVFVEQATGLGSYDPKDAARSRQEALEAAFRDAVEQASGQFITAETEVRNFELVKDEVLTRSQGFVREYHITKEGREGDTYKIIMQANVEKAAFIKDINASLELLYQRVGKPRVVVVVTERNDPLGEKPDAKPTTSLSVTEKEIRRILLKQGFNFVDARAVLGGDVLEAAVTGGGVQRDAAVRVAKTAEAEIVIIGRAQTQSKGQIQKFHSVVANLSLDVVRVDNGQVMASESVVTPPAIDLDISSAGLLALKKAAEEITPKMMEQVTYQWIKERNEGSRVEIIVENISFGDLVAFRKALGISVKGVKQVNQRSYKDGVALIEVLTRSTTAALAESLYEAKFDKFQVEVRDVSGNRLTVAVNKR